MKRTRILQLVLITVSLILIIAPDTPLMATAEVLNDKEVDAKQFNAKQHYGDFEPYIDTQTMELHYTKYYKNAQKHLTKICNYYPQLQHVTLKELLTQNHDIPKPVQTTLKKVAGDVYNHTFFFETLSSQSTKQPLPNLRQAITKTYGSFKIFKSEYIETAINQNMYGWIWLVVNEKDELEIIYTNHYDTPNLKTDTPLIVADTWIHSYYLTYENSLENYLSNIFEIIDWERAENLYLETIS